VAKPANANAMVNAAASPQCQLARRISAAAAVRRDQAEHSGTLSRDRSRAPHKTVARFGKTAYFWHRLKTQSEYRQVAMRCKSHAYHPIIVEQ